jgi:hypothetical protein
MKHHDDYRPSPDAAEELMAENTRLRDALQGIISHYDEFGARTRGMDMILADCRRLLETKK